VRGTLELHPFNSGESYYLGAFLVGAYQEILGDMHNLFGDTNAVHINLLDDGGYEIDDFIPGDRVSEVLNYVQFSAEKLVERMRKDVDKAVRAGKITAKEARQFLRFYEDGMDGYTYLEE
jgi:arginine decarboxylase